MDKSCCTHYFGDITDHEYHHYNTTGDQHSAKTAEYNKDAWYVQNVHNVYYIIVYVLIYILYMYYCICIYYILYMY